MLGSTEPALMLEDNHFGPPSLTRVLLCVSLVCKRWSSIANGLLFKRSQVCSHSALQSYNKVLRNAQKKGMSIDFVNSFSYFPPLMELADRKSRATPQNKRQDIKDLRETFTLLPTSTTFNLKVSPAQFTYLMGQTWFRANDLTMLHLAVPSTTKDGVNLPFEFPNLRTLVFQRIRIAMHTVLPTVPNLQNLRLIQVDLSERTSCTTSTNFMLDAFQNLRKVELIEVHFDKEMLKPFLRHSSQTLEYLSLINVGGPEYSLLIYDLGFLQALRGLCIGPYAFKEDQMILARTRFPESLERLTIWELLKPKLVDGTIPFCDNVTGLKNYLSTVRYHNPHLRTIRIRGADFELRPKKATLEEACKSPNATDNLTLEMSTYKCESPFRLFVVNKCLVIHTRSFFP